MEPSDFPSTRPAPIVVRLINRLTAWGLSRRITEALIAHIYAQGDFGASATETEERAAFRTMLMAEISSLRQTVRQQDADKDVLRQCLNTALAQTLILRATVEIMEQRVAFNHQRRRLDSDLS